MGLIVTAYSHTAVNLAPETVEEEVLQNIHTILSTPKFTVPMARGFGISTDFVDKPMPVAEALCVSAVLDAIARYEERAEVEQVTFTKSADGRLVPRVEVTIHA